MKKAKIIGLFLLSLTLGFVTGQVIKSAYESSSFKPFGWGDDPPFIANCYGKEFSELQMIRAMDYWSIRGYSTGIYIHNPPESVCSKEWLRGFIILRKASAGELRSEVYASTKRYTTLTRMKAAVITYQPGSFNLDLINEHELGHALGFTHLEEDGHIMHPNYWKMGRDFYLP